MAGPPYAWTCINSEARIHWRSEGIAEGKEMSVTISQYKISFSYVSSSAWNFFLFTFKSACVNSCSPFWYVICLFEIMIIAC